MKGSFAATLMQTARVCICATLTAYAACTLLWSHVEGCNSIQACIPGPAVLYLPKSLPDSNLGDPYRASRPAKKPRIGIFSTLLTDHPQTTCATRRYKGYLQTAFLSYQPESFITMQSAQTSSAGTLAVTSALLTRLKLSDASDEWQSILGLGFRVQGLGSGALGRGPNRLERNYDM